MDIQLSPKPLHPLSSGVIVIVGAKSSNFDEYIKTHPRVILWDSQDTSWTRKDLPSNTRVVFMTRFIGHSDFNRIVSDAKKRNITIFNPDGTGIIARQVKELLALTPPPTSETTQSTTQKESETMDQTRGRLKVLHPFIDMTKGNLENARFLFAKAKEMGIQTTEASLGQMVSHLRRKQVGAIGVPRSVRKQVDVSVEILDNMIKELQDMRQFLMDTVDENKVLRMKLDKFKKVFDE